MNILWVLNPEFIHQMKISSPDKIFIPAPPETNCACNDCPYMKLNTLEKLYLCMEYEMPEITDAGNDLLIEARKPIERMLEISRHDMAYKKLPAHINHQDLNICRDLLH